MRISPACKPGLDAMNLEANVISLLKLFFLHDQKLLQKLKYLENEKSFLDEIKNIYSSFLKGFQSSI